MLPDRPSKHPETLSRIVDGEAMVLVQQPEVVTIVLNQVATRVWELLDGSRDLKEIALLIGDEFDVSQATVEADVREVVEDMGRKGMLDMESSRTGEGGTA